MGISILLHLLAVVLAISVRISVDTPVLTAGTAHVVLIAPRPSKAQSRILPKPRRALLPGPMPRPTPKKMARVFIALDQTPAAPKLVIREAPSGIAEAPTPIVASPGFAPLNLVRPQPKLGLFASDVAVEPIERVSRPRLAAFGDASASAAIPVAKSAAQGGFSDATTAASATRSVSAAAIRSTPLQILNKPRPEYTDEARRLGLQGEVVLEAQFLTSGEIRVLRILRGLGHGLDETATEAVRRIRYQPASKDGQPVDSVVTIYLQFELAK